MVNLALGLWLILFSVLGLVPTEIPKWILPLTAGIVGVIVLLRGEPWWKRGPQAS